MTQPQAQQRIDRTTYLCTLLGGIKDKSVIQQAIELCRESRLEQAIELAQKTIELQKCL